MNTQKYKKPYTFFITIIITIFFSISLNAQKPTDTKAISNLINGINSENEGLRRSSIYFAGKYEYRETTSALVEQLKKEKNPNTRLLIANSLFRIGDPEAMKSVLEISRKDSNNKVRRIAGAIYEAFSVINASDLDTKLAQQ
jgi:HEAT repeat protein